MMHRAWSSIGKVPYCFWRSYVKFQGHTALKIVEFDPNWAFPDRNSSLNSPMAMKCCTKLETAKERCPIVFQGHPSNFKVTRDKTSPILTQIGRFRTIGGRSFQIPQICLVQCHLSNFKAPLLHYINLCVSSQTPPWIQTGVTVPKRTIRVKIGDFLSCVTLKFDGWPWKTIGHLFCPTLSFVRHFKPIGEFKIKLQSENAQFGSKSTIFWAVWPRNFTDDVGKQ